MIFFDALWQTESKDHISVATESFAVLKGCSLKWLTLAEETIQSGGKIMFFGNGGSAADAQHIAAELTVRLKQNRDPIAAIALASDPSSMTAAANDLGFDQVFARQIQALGKEGDMAVGISTSGNSENVLNALKMARDMKIKTVGLTGANGDKMSSSCDVLLKVPSTNTARIQEMHITMGHVFCSGLEKGLGLV